MKRIWTKFRNYIPCSDTTDFSRKSEAQCDHKSCRLWNLGYRVGVRKFLWFKWLEFTKD